MPPAVNDDLVMQMHGRRIARRAGAADRLALPHAHPRPEARRIVGKMRVAGFDAAPVIDEHRLAVVAQRTGRFDDAVTVSGRPV